VQPLPRYTRRKWLKGPAAWGYFFEVPTWARKPDAADLRGPCPVESEELGTDYAAAVARVETVKLPQFDSWRSGGLSDITPEIAAAGTLDWIFRVYKETGEFKTLDPKTRALHEHGFNLVGNYLLKDGRRLGVVHVASIDTGVVDPLYEKLLNVPTEDGTTRERRTTVNHAMKSCRRAWNVAYRRHPKIVPAANPFSRMGLKASKRVTPTATYAELFAAVAKADALGLSSLGTAMMLTWEWLQREEHIFSAFDVTHYRPKDRPREVKIVHPKNDEEVWVPLFDAGGRRLFPELMDRLDTVKQGRIGGLMFVRDWSDRAPWPSKSGDLTLMRHKAKEIILAAGIRPEISFTSFRHGGLTELGDADLTDAQIRALSRQKSTVLPRYIKRTEQQIIRGTRKRRTRRKPAP
jgi:hypothetical protein